MKEVSDSKISFHAACNIRMVLRKYHGSYIHEGYRSTSNTHKARGPLISLSRGVLRMTKP